MKRRFYQRQCPSVAMSLRCYLPKGHEGTHRGEGVGRTVGNWKYDAPFAMWADSVQEVRESGLFSPWMADALEEIELERKEKA